jgi:hypothetical protein
MTVLLLYSLQSNQSACELQALAATRCELAVRAGTRRSQCPYLQPARTRRTASTQRASPSAAFLSPFLLRLPPFSLPLASCLRTQGGTRSVRKQNGRPSMGGARRFGPDRASSRQPRAGECTHVRSNRPRRLRVLPSFAARRLCAVGLLSAVLHCSVRLYLWVSVSGSSTPSLAV